MTQLSLQSPKRRITRLQSLETGLSFSFSSSNLLRHFSNYKKEKLSLCELCANKLYHPGCHDHLLNLILFPSVPECFCLQSPSFLPLFLSLFLEISQCAQLICSKPYSLRSLAGAHLMILSSVSLETFFLGWGEMYLSSWVGVHLSNLLLAFLTALSLPISHK